MNVQTQPDPRNVLLVSDWAGSLTKARDVIENLDFLLPGEPDRIILHLGAFTQWPGDVGFFNGLQTALEDAGRARLWFTDGDFSDIQKIGGLARIGGPHDPVDVRLFLRWIPTGYRWFWRTVLWVALGGQTWWPEAEITDSDIDEMIASGVADVLVTQEVPLGVPLSGHPDPFTDNDKSAANRRRVRKLVDALRVSHIFHGQPHAEDTKIRSLGIEVPTYAMNRHGFCHRNVRVVNLCDMTVTPLCHNAFESCCEHFDVRLAET